MGRIKTTLIKRRSKTIFDAHKDKVKDSFEGNKEVLAQVADIESKKMRNVIAGYLTRLAKNER